MLERFMIAAERIARVLGGPKVLGRRVRSIDELRTSVARGLPRRALDNCASWLAAGPRERRAIVHQIIPEASYKRRRTAMKPAESERTERLARVIATAEHVWDDREAARRFLLTPNANFKGERPVDVARSEIGARQVEDLLWQIFHGLPV